jgi:hypothetical protein
MTSRCSTGVRFQIRQKRASQSPVATPATDFSTKIVGSNGSTM